MEAFAFWPLKVPEVLVPFPPSKSAPKGGRGAPVTGSNAFWR